MTHACRPCEGYGYILCPECKGTGRIHIPASVEEKPFIESLSQTFKAKWSVCSACEGKGKGECPTCEGSGKEERKFPTGADTMAPVSYTK